MSDPEFTERVQRVHDAAVYTAELYGPTSTLVAVPAEMLLYLTNLHLNPKDHPCSCSSPLSP